MLSLAKASGLILANLNVALLVEVAIVFALRLAFKKTLSRGVTVCRKRSSLVFDKLLLQTKLDMKDSTYSNYNLLVSTRIF